MDFIYSFIDKLDIDVDVDINVDSVYNHLNKSFNIVCYHIDTTGKYPFLQFLLVYHNNMFTFPKGVDIRDTLTKMKLILDIQGTLIKGLYQNKYLFIHIPNISIPNISNLIDTISIQFVLPTEIINNQSVLNIDIDKKVVNLFTDVRELGHLIDAKNNYYMLPDVVYSGSEKKQAEFRSIFGNIKTKMYNSCGEYYFFYRSFGNAVKDGGWLKKGEPEKIGNRQIVNINTNKYITGCINRYALFVEGKIYFENNKDFMLSDETIENLYPEPCIIICYSSEYNVNPDILVKKYNNFICLSYHNLDNSLIDDCFIETNKKQYMIE